jgi:hypothetical protein
MLKESLRILFHLDNRLAIAENLSRFAATVVIAGQPDTAARLVSSSEALREEIGGSFAWLARTNRETLDHVRAQLDQGAFADAWKNGQRLTIAQAVAFALDIQIDIEIDDATAGDPPIRELR